MSDKEARFRRRVAERRRADPGWLHQALSSDSFLDNVLDQLHEAACKGAGNGHVKDLARWDLKHAITVALKRESERNTEEAR